MNLKEIKRQYARIINTYTITIWQGIVFIREPINVGDLVFLRNYFKFYKIDYYDIRVGVRR